MAEEAAKEAAKEVAPELKELGDKIAGLTLLQAKSLSDYLKDAHGIEAAAGGAVMVAPPGAQEGADEEDKKSAFDVMLVKVPDQTKKIAVIKIVREITGLGLKEAKDVVDKAPQAVKSGVPTEDAEALKAKLEKEGAVVELK
jgi:large subunit ribosomal protein L7/L12